MRQLKRREFAALTTLFAAGLPLVSRAQAYPARAIKLVAPYPAGGPTDIMARLVAQKLAEVLNQQVLVENRAGAGGVIGVDMVAKSAPDGYTLVMASSGPFVINPGLQKLSYDPVKDFSPISLIGAIPTILVINPKLPVNTFSELVTYAKARPGQLNFGSTGNGATPHMAGELLKFMAGLDIKHVPYKGSAPALTDLMGGQIDLMFDGVSAALPHVKTGKLRALAVGSIKRVKAVPELPTVSELGLTGFDVVPWYAILGPAGLPADVVARLNSALVNIMKQPDVVEKLAGMGAEATATTPQVLAKTIADELPRWASLIKSAGITAG